MNAPKPPLRPATPIDIELAKPHPDEMTELEKKREEAERDIEAMSAGGLPARSAPIRRGSHD